MKAEPLLVSKHEPPAPGLFVRLYITGCFLLSGLAVSYLTLLLVQPDWAPKLSSFTMTAENSQKGRAVGQLSAELESLRRTVADLQRDLAYVKSNLAAHQERETAEQARLATDDSAALRPPVLTGPAGPVPGMTITTLNANSARTTPEREPAGAPDDRGQKPKLPAVAPKPSDGIETGSLPAAAPKIAFGPAKITSAAPGPATAAAAAPSPPPAPVPSGPVGLVLERAPSLDSLRLKWTFLSERHGSLLRDLEARYNWSVAGQDGRTYQLIAGPIPTADEARRICALLRVQKVPCGVSSAFKGDVL